MIKKFYEKALPSQGVYCTTGIDPNVKNRVINKFAETLDDLFDLIEKHKANNLNTFVALGTFEGFSRKADDCLYLKSFFIDLDVGPNKEYDTKGDAHAAIFKLVAATGLPDPVCIDSGGGIHAYWIMDEDIPKEEWVIYAEKFKALCMDHIAIDPVVTADAARVLRCPDSFNYKSDPPLLTSVLTDEIAVYSWEEFKEFLGVKEEKPSGSLFDLLPKGLDEDTRAMMKLDNFEINFEKIVDKSMDGAGCEQIKYAVENIVGLPEPVWRYMLSVAKFTSDGVPIAHALSSQDVARYSEKATNDKLNKIQGTLSCKEMDNLNPGVCSNCIHYGKQKNCLFLGKELRTEKPAEPIEPTFESDEEVQEEEKPIRIKADTPKVPDFPDFLAPFVRGINGGIYYQPPSVYDKKSKKYIEQDAMLLSYYDVYPYKRLVSPHDGECLMMRVHTPHDGVKDFLLPMKQVYALDKFREIMSTNGVYFPVASAGGLMEYVVKWGQYLSNTDRAEQMRMQMGWTEDEGFVIGNKEFTKDGIFEAPSSPFVRGLSKHLNKKGTYERWRESVDKLNEPSYETHAYGLLCGFGAPIVRFTNVSGFTVSFTGESGNGKTGAMYAGLSVMGNPKDQAVFEATDNALTNRMVMLKNLMYGIDESSNHKPEKVADLIHKISQGSAKIRLQASANAEREHLMGAQTILITTTNNPLQEKLGVFKEFADGENARLIEYLVRKPIGLDQDAEFIFDALKYNYGHAGPMFIEELIRLGEDEIRATVRRWQTKFNLDFGQKAEYRYYTASIAAPFAAGEIAVKAGIIDLDLERVYQAMLHDILGIVKNVTQVNRKDYETLVGDFCNKYQNGILIINSDHKVFGEPRIGIVGRAEVDEGKVYISKTELKKYLAERQVSVRQFEVALKAKKFLDGDKRMRLTAGWKGGLDMNINVYQFNMEIPDEWKKEPVVDSGA
jgi:hypothetical protein